MRAAIIAFAFGAVLALLLILTGCATIPASPPDSIPAVGSSIEKAQAHVGSAEAAVQRAKPEASVTGKALLDVASEEHGKANAELEAAKAETVKVQKERDILEKQKQELAGVIEDRDAALSKIKSGWGYRLQVVVTHFLILLAVLVGVHFLAGFAAVIPAFAGAAPVLLIIGRICNPIAWFQTIVDGIHFKRKCTEAVVIPD
jgi:hypothetical protein